MSSIIHARPRRPIAVAVVCLCAVIGTAVAADNGHDLVLAVVVAACFFGFMGTLAAFVVRMNEEITELNARIDARREARQAALRER
jgi:hypothetical protein